jgi:hypothetical protein
VSKVTDFVVSFCVVFVGWLKLLGELAVGLKRYNFFENINENI